LASDVNLVAGFSTKGSRSSFTTRQSDSVSRTYSAASLLLSASVRPMSGIPVLGRAYLALQPHLRSTTWEKMR
jgi:hypothetical protein